MVTDTILIVLGITVLCLVAVVLIVAAEWRALIHAQDESTTVHAPPPPAPVAAPKPSPEPPKRSEQVTCRLMDVRGRLVGTYTLDRKFRRPSMQFRTKRGLGNFVAERLDGKEWVYRQVSTDRE